MDENTPNRAGEVARDWIFYDGECSLCLATVERFGSLLRHHHFRLAPLQTPWVQKRLALNPGEPLVEMKLLAPDGRVYGGADALLQIAKNIWWAWPLFVLAKIPGVTGRFHVFYRWIAANRTCLGNACQLHRPNRVADYLPLLLLPPMAFLTRSMVPAWGFMWLLALAVYSGCKWLTWRQVEGANFARSFGYLFGWIGMDAKQFLASGAIVAKPKTPYWWLATAKTLGGAALIWLVARHLITTHPLVAGWVSMIGIVLCLHFGLFALLALAWQRAGVNTTPIMEQPLRATSLADFWGHRWNGAFHILAHEFIFKKLVRKQGLTIAIFAVFLISGLVHDAIISLPARGGYGLPTAYFLIQALGVIFERTVFARQIGLGHGWRGWLFTVATTAGPAGWLFHPPFIYHIILPMLHAIGAT